MTDVPGGGLGNPGIDRVDVSGSMEVEEVEELKVLVVVVGRWEELEWVDVVEWEVGFGGQAPGKPFAASKQRVVMVERITTVVVRVVVVLAVVVALLASETLVGIGIGADIGLVLGSEIGVEGGQLVIVRQLYEVEIPSSPGEGVNGGQEPLS